MPKGEGVLEALSELEKDLGNPRGRKRRKEVAKASAVEGERVDGQELRKRRRRRNDALHLLLHTSRARMADGSANSQPREPLLPLFLLHGAHQKANPFMKSQRRRRRRGRRNTRRRPRHPKTGVLLVWGVRYPTMTHATFPLNPVKTGQFFAKAPPPQAAKAYSSS